MELRVQEGAENFFKVTGGCGGGDGCDCACHRAAVVGGGQDLQVASFLRAISRNCLMSVTSRGMAVICDCGGGRA